MTQPRIGIYPGTFDPITNGHSDIIRRAIKVVDRLVIGVARNDGKGPLFATDERVEIVRDEVAHLENDDAERVEVRAFDTLLVNFAQSVGASVIIVNGALACYVTRGEKELRIFLPDDEPSRSIVAKEVAKALASLVETGLRRALLFTEVDDEIAPFLVEAGFRRTSTGYQMRHA